MARIGSQSYTNIDTRTSSQLEVCDGLIRRNVLQLQTKKTIKTTQNIALIDISEPKTAPGPVSRAFRVKPPTGQRRDNFMSALSGTGVNSAVGSYGKYRQASSQTIEMTLCRDVKFLHKPEAGLSPAYTCGILPES